MNKRQQLIEGALRLFYTRGIHAVGINEVLKTTGVAKKTLYTHFASKDDLILACLQLRHERFIEWFSGLLAEKQQSKEAIIYAFYGLQAWFNGEISQLGEFRGCFFVNASAEFSDPDSSVNQLCRQHKDDIKSLFADCLRRTISDKTLIEVFSQQLCILKEGCISEARVRHNPYGPQQIVPLIEELLRTIK